MPQNRQRRSERHREPAYEAQPAAPGFPGQPSVQRYEEARASYGDEYAPLEPVYAPMEDQAYEPLPESWEETAPRRRFGLYHAVFFISLLIIAGMAAFVVRSALPAAEFEHRRATMRQNIIFEGVTVDGLPIGGLTRQQAAQKVQGTGGGSRPLSLNLHVDGAVYTLTEKEIPYGRSVDEVLDAAYAVGRQGFPWMIGSDKTPFDIRWEHTLHIAKAGMALQTKAAYSDEALRSLSEGLARAASREPVNAQLASFDFDTRAFSVTRDEAGTSLSAQTVYDALSKALKAGQTEGDIILYSEPVMPSVTAVELQNNLNMISSFTTQATSDALRNENIALAAAAIHGLAIMPGESFSFNQMVGQRTPQRGYRMAPAIAGGQTVDEIGGGVCQVSSTLFNAAAMADMSIVTREPHAWPSNYVDMGLDATVNWPNLDFVFRNDTGSPVFIAADFRGRKLTVELYGLRADSAESIILQTELIASTPPPADPEYRQNASLFPGTRQEVKKARTGYLVDTYRVYLRDGVPYRREKLFTSNYPAIRQVIEYN